MNTMLNNKTLLELAMKWKYHLLIIAVIAGVVSVIFSAPHFIKPKYKSFAVVYPDNLGEYSEESHTEQMLELLNSGDIRDQIIEAFRLDDHYRITRDYQYYQTAMIGKYSDNVTFRKTDNEAVRIEVLDTDPKIACAMVDSILVYYDRKVRAIHNRKYKEELDIRTAELGRIRSHVDSLHLRLEYIGREFGVMDAVGQAEGLSSAYFSMLAQGRTDTESGRKLRDMYHSIAAKSPEFSGIFLEMEYTYDLMGKTQALYNDAFREYTKNISYSNLVSRPFVSDKKAWPKRSVIVLGSVLLTLLLALVIIAAIENRNLHKAH